MSTANYAIIKQGSRQFRVSEGETLVVDRVTGNQGDKVTFDNVLLVGGAKTVIGTPQIQGASVEATIESQFKDRKITVFKYKRRKNYKKTVGHRQPKTLLKIGKIKA